VFVSENAETGERRVYWVIALTTIMMMVEILSGWWFNSMALLADGWHMASHSAALLITVFAYWYARRHLRDARYTFGTGKVGVLGGFTSGVVLGLVALLMVWESAQRIADPVTIRFDEAMLVAIIGLGVNVVSAVLLHQRPRHPKEEHDHSHGHAHAQSHQDHNLRAAFLHVVADALTSILAIVALLCGKAFGWVILDPLMGIAGAVLIGHWTFGLLRDTGRILLDGSARPEIREHIRQRIEADADNQVTDIHVWWLGSNHLAAIVSVVTHWPRGPEHYKALLADVADLVHITIEVNACAGEPCVPLNTEAEV
jgi:cation diffusion facilitator family transporter